MPPAALTLVGGGGGHGGDGGAHRGGGGAGVGRGGGGARYRGLADVLLSSVTAHVVPGAGADALDLDAVLVGGGGGVGLVGVPVGPRPQGRPVAPHVAALRRLVVETDPGVLPAQDRVDEGVLLLGLYLGEGATPSTGALVLRIVVTQLLRGEFVALRPSVSDV